MNGPKLPKTLEAALDRFELACDTSLFSDKRNHARDVLAGEIYAYGAKGNEGFCVPINAQIRAHLRVLVASGFYGLTDADAALRLIERQLIEGSARQLIEQLDPPPPQRARRR